MTETGARRFRAVIVDDEPAGRDAVRTFLEEVPAVDIVGEAHDGAEAVAVVTTTRPDLLFLDIQMPGRDGFAVLEALGEAVPPGVVLVTAHGEYAQRAFDVHAVDYVTKPFGRPRFMAAVRRALHRLAAEEALDMRGTLRSLVEGLRLDRVAGPSDAGALDAGALDPGTVDAGAADLGAADLGPGDAAASSTSSESGGGGPASRSPDQGASTGQPRRIGVRLGNRTTLVDVGDIDWIEADGDLVRLHVDDRVHLVQSRMRDLEKTLPSHFGRIHRSVIVNLDRVDVLHRDPDGGGSVRISTGVQLRVARGRWEALERALGLADG